MISNYFLMELQPKNSTGVEGTPWAIIGENRVDIEYGVLTPLCKYQDGSKKIIVLGHPSFNDVIDIDEFSRTFFKGGMRLGQLKKINGEFLIIYADEDKQCLKIINSRFASPIFFFAKIGKRFIGSTSYHTLCKKLIKYNSFEIKPEVFYQFINYRRIFGRATYDKHSEYLPPARVLTFSNGWKEEEYWRPNYTKNKNSLADNVDMFGQVIRDAVRFKSSDDNRYGLFLSGGLDTRTFLAYFDEPVRTYTTTYTKNKEYQVAHQLSKWKNSPHTWFEVKLGQYRKHLDTSAALTGGMYMADGLFHGHQSLLQSETDVIFAGYGMDYFFQGMYLPSNYLTIKGKVLYYKWLDKTPEDRVDYFLNRISYNTKGLPIKDIVGSKYNSMREYLRAVIDSEFVKADSYTDNFYDAWEHVSLGDVSRHYTYGGQLALMNLQKYRTLAYCNDVYDLYLQLPINQRFDAKLMRKALKKADPRFYKHQSANHGQPAGYSSFTRTAMFLAKYGIDTVIGARKRRKFDRTWLPSDEVLRGELRDSVLELGESDYLDNLGIIDMTLLNQSLTKWKNKEIEGGQTFLVLLTIDRFLKNIYGET